MHAPRSDDDRRPRFSLVTRTSSFVCQRCGDTTESYAYDHSQNRVICAKCHQIEMDDFQKSQEPMVQTPEQSITSETIALLLRTMERVKTLEIKVQALEQNVKHPNPL